MASQAAALDDMERVLYAKEKVLVQATDGQSRPAYTYIWKGRQDELGSEPWDIEFYLKETGLNI